MIISRIDENLMFLDCKIRKKERNFQKSVSGQIKMIRRPISCCTGVLPGILGGSLNNITCSQSGNKIRCMRRRVKLYAIWSIE